MTFRNEKILTVALVILLLVSAFLNLYLAAIVLPRYDQRFSNLTEQYHDLREADTAHQQKLIESNATILQLSESLAVTEIRLGEVSGTLNSTIGAYRGSASLEVPVVIQKTKPGISDEETGGMMNVTVEVRTGKGRVLVETKPLLGFTFQETATDAAAAARNFTHADLSENDVVFTMKSQEQTNSIDGPSAGALMCILLVSVIDGRSLDSNVTVTGTIEPDGTIRGVGGLLEKAEAAHAAGKTLLLIPEANKDAVVVRGSGLYGEREQVDTKTYLEEMIGIHIEYVDTIADLPEYMFA